MTENHFNRISRHFRSIPNLVIFDFFLQTNNPRWPFWMTENDFRLHFSPFEINVPLLFLFFFTKWLPGSILDDRKSLLIAFLTISDQYATSFLPLFFQNGRRRPFWKSGLGHFGWPKINFDRISRHFRSICNFFFWKFLFKMAAGGHFGSLICAKNNRVLPLWVINGYAIHEVDRWIYDRV